MTPSKTLLALHLFLLASCTISPQVHDPHDNSHDVRVHIIDALNGNPILRGEIRTDRIHNTSELAHTLFDLYNKDTFENGMYILRNVTPGWHFVRIASSGYDTNLSLLELAPGTHTTIALSSGHTPPCPDGNVTLLKWASVNHHRDAEIIELYGNGALHYKLWRDSTLFEHSKLLSAPAIAELRKILHTIDWNQVPESTSQSKVASIQTSSPKIRKSTDSFESLPPTLQHWIKHNILNTTYCTSQK